MNSKRLEELARRRQALIVSAANERAELAAACDKVRSSLDFSQKFLWIGRALKAHPMIATGISSLLVSGLAGKVFKGAGQIASLLRLGLPLWTWWTTRRKSS